MDIHLDVVEHLLERRPGARLERGLGVAVHAHILVCFLAYVLWKMLGQMCKRAGLGDEPRKVFDEIAQIKAVDVVMPTKQGAVIRKRCIAQPTKAQAILLQKLQLHLPQRMKTHDM